MKLTKTKRKELRPGDMFCIPYKRGVSEVYIVLRDDLIDSLSNAEVLRIEPDDSKKAQVAQKRRHCKRREGICAVHRWRSSGRRSAGDDMMPDTSEETLDNCLKLCSELRRMGFSENSSTTSIIPEDALATAAYNQQPLSPEGLVQARYAGIYLVEYKFFEALGNREYRLTGKDVEMCEKQILEIVNRNPGCTPGYFSDQQHEEIHGLIGKGAIVRRYHGMMPCYYTPEQMQERA